MAKAQKEISVSEFFAKNRHLLGFDNPRKALLTTVKEAVDNSLDACEEAGILPEIWVKITRVSENRFRVSVQDAGPGIEPKQIPLIYGKLLYGSKFHRLRMSRGQQGIGISAAGMYGLLTTGKPLEVLSKTSVRRPTTWFIVRIDSKTNTPEVLNGAGQGESIPANEEGRRFFVEHNLDWVPVDSGTRVTIELEAKYARGRGSVDEYLAQTALANLGIIPVRHEENVLVDIGGFGGFRDLLHGGIRHGIADIFRNGAVEEERVARRWAHKTGRSAG